MQSDLHIPHITAMIDRALDYRASAERQRDGQALRQIDRMIAKLPGATLCWQLGTLHIVSPSGGRYQVSRAGCSCPNGAAGRRQCWHVSVFELLQDMLETETETRDQAADPPGENPLGDSEGDPEPPDRPRHIGVRLAAARAVYSL